VLQGGDAVEVAVSGIVDAVWYAAVFVVVAVVVLAGLDWTLLVPILVWLALYALLFAVVMPRIAKQSAVVSEGRSVITGRIVDSYTNIQTLKTFSSAKHEDKYVSDSAVEHTLQYRGLMREFTYMWSALYLPDAQTIATIPDDLIEAARIDGASELRIFVSIVLPLRKPTLATLAIINVIWRWNDVLWPLLVTSNRDFFTVTQGLALAGRSQGIYTGVALATAVMAILPVIVAYLFLQRYVIRSVVSSGVKG
jgi:ABC-type multidrug transport system fused ATPase/permease subunit